MIRIRWSRAALLAAALACAPCTPAFATTVSGFLNDPSNAALVASDGYADVRAARFANDGEIARNVAAYTLTVSTAGTIAFVSSGFALGGLEPYFSLFAGTGPGATFVDSSYFDPAIDFSLSFPSLAVGSYVFAIGVFSNLSFAENNPDADPTLGDGFTALGDPTRLNSGFYRLDMTSADGGVFSITPAQGLVVPPTTVPEPASMWLIGAGSTWLLARRRRPRGKSFTFLHGPPV